MNCYSCLRNGLAMVSTIPDQKHQSQKTNNLSIQASRRDGGMERRRWQEVISKTLLTPIQPQVDSKGTLQ